MTATCTEVYLRHDAAEPTEPAPLTSDSLETQLTASSYAKNNTLSWKHLWRSNTCSKKVCLQRQQVVSKSKNHIPIHSHTGISEQVQSRDCSSRAVAYAQQKALTFHHRTSLCITVHLPVHLNITKHILFTMKDEDGHNSTLTHLCC